MSAAAWTTTASERFRRVLHDLRCLARSRTVPILLEGESGTGKTMLARLVHHWSPRVRAPFQTVVLSSLDDGLAASTLFGHVAGAFTGARDTRAGAFVSGQGGTLFLDDLGKASATVQQRLLHAIETGEVQPVGADRTIHVDVRIVVATNVGLENLVAKGVFLPDLYARVEAFRVRLPALRERRCDIPRLAAEVVRRHAADCGYEEPPGISNELMQALTHAPWPYNLRQLDTTIHHIMLRAERAPTLRLDACAGAFDYLVDLGRERTPLTTERARLTVATAGSVTAAARLLGVDRTTIYRHLRQAPQDVSPGTGVARTGTE